MEPLPSVKEQMREQSAGAAGALADEVATREGDHDADQDEVLVHSFLHICLQRDWLHVDQGRVDSAASRRASARADSHPEGDAPSG